MLAFSFPILIEVGSPAAVFLAVLLLTGQYDAKNHGLQEK